MNSALASEYRASCERLVSLLDANTLLICHDGKEAAESEINMCYSHLSLVHHSIAQAWSELTLILQQAALVLSKDLRDALLLPPPTAVAAAWDTLVKGGGELLFYLPSF